MAAAAIVVVIAVVANLLVNALPAGATQFDISAGSMFTMSQETEQLLDGLDQDITVYWLVQSGQEDETLGTLLDRYTSRSDRVTLEKRDPDVDPNFVQEYVTGTVYNNSLIVESEARYTYVSYEDIYTYEYGDDGASYYMNFAGESALTSAIDYVIRDTLPKLYTLTGHGESALSASFQSAVEKQNMELEELSLLTAEEVPEDADCLLICGPESDLSQEEKEAILAYLQEGGDLILLTDPAQTGEERPNLEELMAEYGMSSAQGVVVEGDPSHYALGSPVYLLPNLESHTITSPLQEGGYYILMALAQGLKLEEFPREGLSVSPLLTTSDEAYSKLAGYGMETYQKEEGDEAGPFALAAAATETLADAQRAMWFGLPPRLCSMINTTSRSPARIRIFSSTVWGGPVKRRRESPFMPRP
ncbi:MAG: Gldg family protein [Evtepia gabavorous]